jgi:hypothetical protein
VEGAAASARVVFMVSPGGTTSLEVVAKARNGAVIAGNAEDVSCMQVQKSTDLSVAKSQAEEIATRLAFAFLLNTSIQRSGERVTAEEIRYMASELDDSLGGVYTLLAADLQLPVVRLFERRMEKRLKVGPLPSEKVRPVLVSGLEAIGRGHDQANLRAFVAEIVQAVGPETAFQFMNPQELIRRSAAAYNVDPNGLIASDEEIQQRQQAAQLQALVQNLGPEALKQFGGLANTVAQQTGGGAPTGEQ